MSDVASIEQGKKAIEKGEALLMTFTNHKNNENLGILQGLLKMFYHTVLTNRLAIMQAKNTETGEEEIVLVGIEQNGDAINAFPLALRLGAQDAAKYQAPTGDGGWVENKTEEVA